MTIALGTSKSKLENLTSPHMAFYIDSEASLSKVFTNQYNNIAKPLVVVEKIYTTKMLLRISSKMKGIQGFKVLVLYPQEREYREACDVVIPDPDNINLQVELEALPSNSLIYVKVKTLPENLLVPEVILNERTPKELERAVIMSDLKKITDKVNEMTEKLNNWKIDSETKDKLQIQITKLIIFGRMGSGKSSYLNTIYASLKGEYEPICITNASAETVTQKLQGISLSDCLEITDTWGWQSNNYQTQDIERIVRGQFPEGTHEQSLTRDNMVNDVTYADNHHGALLTFPATMIPYGEEIAQFNRFYSTIGKIGISQPVVILTKLDLMDETLSTNPERIFISDIVQSVMKEFSEKTGVPDTMIFPTLSYLGFPEKRDFVREYLALHPLSVAMAAPKAFYYRIKREASLKSKK